jgi:hypothetical protein
MTRKIWRRIMIVRYGFESLAGEVQYDLKEKWTRQNIIDRVFMLY